MTELDALDLALLGALRDSPRAGVLQLSRITQVARATVQARLDRMERAGVITGYGPDIDLAAYLFEQPQQKAFDALMKAFNDEDTPTDIMAGVRALSLFGKYATPLMATFRGVEARGPQLKMEPVGLE